MRESRMNVDNLSKPELLTLLSILEGELEARDLVIEALRAQRRDAFVQERYGRYNLSDPFLALQRDSEAVRGRGAAARESSTPSAACPNPLAVLKLVMSHCKRMQEKMLAQLAAAESRHRKVIADLEEEKRRHAQDTAEGDDVTYMLEKERERLLQQLDFEKAQVRRLEKEQKRLSAQVEENRTQHKQLSSALAKECQRAGARVQEEGQRAAELGRRLEEERAATEALRAELEAERKQALQKEARAEEQLAELDTEREQLRARLRKEEGRCRELQAEVEGLRRELVELGGGAQTEVPEGESEMFITASSATAQTDTSDQSLTDSSAPPKLNGHHTEKETEMPCQENGFENGALHSPLQPQPSSSPSPTASPSLGSSPCSSPLLAKRLVGGAPSSPSYQMSYQAGINQRFHAARHKFQGQTEPDQQGSASPRSPRDLSPAPSTPTTPATPTTPTPVSEPTSVKQLARNTVTQVLSRFTSQQGSTKSQAPNSSPFGTDYRSLASSLASPTTTRVASLLSPGIKSPTIPRAERGHPPPIPPKKPGLAQAPMSPGPTARTSHFPELSGSCGLTSTQEGTKEPDLVMSSTS
ncbi:hypothetical protein AGOR_G00155230 [Albula goreensis]|uniref:Cortactin-binding protein-2 N-terminal domain-containing protein n=1 Tax=Albula goreensis TaxID=1534307 RepID=A0A8T3CZ31_9TELE|nr:hypothetical protein AGOR_G00155230 [Albula goreensis]